jgi:hypothetical protein
MAKAKTIKKAKKKQPVKYKITKPKSVIYRYDLGNYAKVYEAKGYTVEKVGE